MKLSGILIASVTAQQPRQRENKEDAGFGGDDYSFGGADDAFASLYDSFGGDDAFGGFDMSAFNDYGFGSTAAPTVAVATDAPDYGFDLGDAFGDAGSDSDAAADYQNTVAADYDGADDLGSIRPSEDDEVKSNFVVDTQAGTEVNLSGSVSGATNEQQNLATIDIQANNGDHSASQRCFVGSAGNSNVDSDLLINAAGVVFNWFENGVWDVCEGENDTCEIKVVRRNEVIQQIHSKCANRHSCVDNMRQNFNPEASTPGGAYNNIFSSWTHQACRPRWNSYGLNTWNARQMARDSVCFFCVEPCRDADIWGDLATSANQMREAECVGKSNAARNAAPIPGSSFKLFEDCSDEEEDDESDANDAFDNCILTIEDDFGETLWDVNAPKQDGNGPDMRKLNYYSTIDNVMLYNTEAGTRHPISLMQDVSRIQYAQMNARDTNDLFTDAVDPNNNFRFSDNGNNAGNLANLFDGDALTVYSRTSSVAALNEYEVEIGFVNEVEITSLTLTKDGSDPFASSYNNVCLWLYEQDGTTQIGSEICTENADGFTGDTNADQDIVFDASGNTGVRIAKLQFDTTGTGNSGAAIDLQGLVMVLA